MRDLPFDDGETIPGVVEERPDDAALGERTPGWLCDCGHWQDDDFHCSSCTRQPPWGCDCEACQDPGGDQDDLDWYPGPWDD